jgi:hypothetical protein
LWKEALYLKETNVEVSVVYRSAGTHCAASFLTPYGVAELQDVIPHNFGESCDKEFNRGGGRELVSIVLEPGGEDFNTVVRVNVGIHADGID